MLSAHRREYIVKLLKNQGKVQTKELVEQLQVSEDTIRRDLDLLAKQEKVKRVHGGALTIERHYIDYNLRSAKIDPIKKAIGLRAAQFVRPNSTILITSGHSCLAFANAIAEDMPLTVISASPEIINAMSTKKNKRIVCLGGDYHRPSKMAFDEQAISQLQQYQIDIGFFGVAAIDFDNGISAPYLVEAQMVGKMFDQVEESFILASKDKFNKTLDFPTTGIQSVNNIISDVNLSSDMLEKIAPYNIHIIIDL